MRDCFLCEKTCRMESHPDDGTDFTLEKVRHTFFYPIPVITQSLPLPKTSLQKVQDPILLLLTACSNSLETKGMHPEENVDRSPS